MKLILFLHVNEQVAGDIRKQIITNLKNDEMSQDEFNHRAQTYLKQLAKTKNHLSGILNYKYEEKNLPRCKLLMCSTDTNSCVSSNCIKHDFLKLKPCSFEKWIKKRRTDFETENDKSHYDFFFKKLCLVLLCPARFFEAD